MKKTTFNFLVAECRERIATTIIGLMSIIAGGFSWFLNPTIGIPLMAFGGFLLSVPIFFGVARITIPKLDKAIAEWLCFYSDGGAIIVLIFDLLFCIGLGMAIETSSLSNEASLLMGLSSAFWLFFTIGFITWNYFEAKTEKSRLFEEIMERKRGSQET